MSASPYEVVPFVRPCFFPPLTFHWPSLPQCFRLISGCPAIPRVHESDSEKFFSSSYFHSPFSLSIDFFHLLACLPKFYGSIWASSSSLTKFLFPLPNKLLFVSPGHGASTPLVSFVAGPRSFSKILLPIPSMTDVNAGHFILVLWWGLCFLTFPPAVDLRLGIFPPLYGPPFGFFGWTPSSSAHFSLCR